MKFIEHKRKTLYADTHTDPRCGIEILPTIKIDWDSGFLLQLEWLFWCVGLYIKAKEK